MYIYILLHIHKYVCSQAISHLYGPKPWAEIPGHTQKKNDACCRIQYDGFRPWGYPQIIPINRIFMNFVHYKSSILGYPHLWKPPDSLTELFHQQSCICSWASISVARFRAPGLVTGRLKICENHLTSGVIFKQQIFAHKWVKVMGDLGSI